MKTEWFVQYTNMSRDWVIWENLEKYNVNNDFLDDTPHIIAPFY